MGLHYNSKWIYLKNILSVWLSNYLHTHCNEKSDCFKSLEIQIDRLNNEESPIFATPSLGL